MGVGGKAGVRRKNFQKMGRKGGVLRVQILKGWDKKRGGGGSDISVWGGSGGTNDQYRGADLMS